MGYQDEQDQRLKFRVYEQFTAALWTRSSSEQENVVGFNGFQKEEDEQEENEQKEWRMKMKQ